MYAAGDIHLRSNRFSKKNPRFLSFESFNDCFPSDYECLQTHTRVNGDTRDGFSSLFCDLEVLWICVAFLTLLFDLIWVAVYTNTMQFQRLFVTLCIFMP